MGSKSSSSSSPTTTTTTTTEVENINLQGIEGPAVVGGEGDINFSISETDQGAVEAAFDFGAGALDVVSGASNRVIDAASLFARESLGLVERSAGAAQRSFEGALASTLGALDDEQSGGAQRVLTLAGIGFAAVVVLAIMMRGR